MGSVRLVDVGSHSLVIDHDLSISTLERKPGPPERLPGMTVGVVEVMADAPHGGENHDGVGPRSTDRTRARGRLHRATG